MPITVSDLPSELSAAFGGGWFTKYVNVFGLNIVARPNVPNEKIIHAAGVMAQYLDNDEDGVPDDLLLVEFLYDKKASLVMFADQADADANLPPININGLLNMINIGLGIGVDNLQDLQGSETIPNSISLDAYKHRTDGGVYTEERFDASLEEVLHLITHAGVSQKYPSVFGEGDSELSSLIDNLNGNCGWGYEGDYKSPSGGECTGFYAYRDETCDYQCTQTEGIYWSLSTILGAQNYTSRLDGIADEWAIGEPEEFKENAAGIHTLLTSYGEHSWLPRTLPNGRYQGTLPVARINGVFDYATVIVTCFSLGVVASIAWCCICFKRGCPCEDRAGDDELRVKLEIVARRDVDSL